MKRRWNRPAPSTIIFALTVLCKRVSCKCARMSAVEFETVNLSGPNETAANFCRRCPAGDRTVARESSLVSPSYVESARAADFRDECADSGMTDSKGLFDTKLLFKTPKMRRETCAIIFFFPENLTRHDVDIHQNRSTVILCIKTFELFSANSMYRNACSNKRKRCNRRKVYFFLLSYCSSQKRLV